MKKLYICLSFLVAHSFCFSMTEADKINLVTKEEFNAQKTSVDAEFTRILEIIAENQHQFTDADRVLVTKLMNDINSCKNEKISLEDYNNFKKRIEQLENLNGKNLAGRYDTLDTRISLIESRVNDRINTYENRVSKIEKDIKNQNDAYAKKFKQIDEAIESLSISRQKVDQKIDDFKNGFELYIDTLNLAFELLSKSLNEFEENMVEKATFNTLEKDYNDLNQNHEIMVQRVHALENMIHNTFNAFKMGGVVIIAYGVYKAFNYIKIKWQQRKMTINL